MKFRETFASYYPLSEEERQRLWDEGYFYLDANFLLNLYRYPERLREDLFRVMATLNTRLFIPYHAALEFHRNYHRVVHEQTKSYETIHSEIEKCVDGIFKTFEKEKVAVRHANIEPQNFETSLRNIWEKFNQDLEQKQQEYPGIVEDVSAQINQLFTDNAISEPTYNQDGLNELARDAENRFSIKRPPGYKDGDKTGEYFHNGLKYKRSIGDYLIWKQVIEHAKENKLNNVVFLTDDTKDDWWWRENGKTRGPRVELRQEIEKEAGVELFHMYNPSGFIEESKKYLALDISDTSVEQAKEFLDLQHTRRSVNKVARRYAAALFHGAVATGRCLMCENNAALSDCSCSNCNEDAPPVLWEHHSSTYKKGDGWEVYYSLDNSGETTEKLVCEVCDSDTWDVDFEVICEHCRSKLP